MSSKQKVADDIAALIAMHAHEIRMITSDLADPARVQREIDRMLAVIDVYKREIARSLQRLQQGPELIAQHEQRIQALRKQLVIADAAAKIEKLLAMIKEAAELEELLT